MSSIVSASELYVIGLGRSSAILEPDSDGVPTVVQPQPLVFRAAYIGPDTFDVQLPIAQGQLLSPNCNLFRPLQSPDGPPYRSGVVFVSQGLQSGMSWRDGSCSHHGSQMQKYAAATTYIEYDWVQDARRGRPGYFLTGQSTVSALWRVFRLEPDAAGRQILTIAPVQLSLRCPRADFSSIGDIARRAEIAAQYDEFCQRVTASAYRDVLTKARNIVEGLVAWKLTQQGQSAGRDLMADLGTVKNMLQEPTTRGSCGWTDLEYHLAHKIRLLHAQTHTGVVTETGRPIRPEFALTVAEDLVELLRIWGHVPA
jgi:hypothetical protein